MIFDRAEILVGRSETTTWPSPGLDADRGKGEAMLNSDVRFDVFFSVFL